MVVFPVPLRDRRKDFGHSGTKRERDDDCLLVLIQ